MAKKVYRTWRDELPLWSLYAALAATAAAVLFFLAPQVWTFLHKLDWKFFARERFLYMRWIIQGLIMTLRISAVSMFFALVVGTLVGVGRLSGSRIVRGLCTPYVEFFRNTPLLVQLFFWYFGTSTLLDALSALVGVAAPLAAGPVAFAQGAITGLKDAYNKGQSEFISGVVGLTVYTSAFIAETVRAGVQAIPHGQTEAARASGLNGFQTLWYVILPQAFRIIIPPLLSQFLALTKNSSQAMAIGVAEVTYMARQVEANTFKGFEAFTVATGLYMVISFLMSWLLNRYDRSITIPEMAKKKQELLARRAVPVGYGLAGVFVAMAAAATLLALGRGLRVAIGGQPWAAVLHLALAAGAAAAAAVALRRPEWGAGFIKTVLTAGAAGAFFVVLQAVNRGLLAFDDPAMADTPARLLFQDGVALPLGWLALWWLVTAWWWLYFSRREVLFQGGSRR